jgi:glycosyltransferase involved in cell wall biosynthesis
MGIRVLHIIKSLGRGGAETLLVETLKHHDREQFEFHFIYFLPWKDQLVNELHAAGAASVSCMKAVSNITILLKAPSLVRYLREQKIDLVHAHLPWAGIVARLACKLAGVPLIYTEHNVQERYHFMTRLLNKWTFHWQQRVIAVSSDVARSIKVNIASNIPVSVVVNGIDTNKFYRNEALRDAKRQPLGFDEDAIVVGTIAVFRQQKRLDIWLEALAMAQAQIPKLRGVIVGDGPLKEQLQEQVKRLGLDDIVAFTGIQADTPAWFSAFEIFMMSSDFEGLPLALLEAMACECAVVATQVGGIPEVVTDGEHGLLSPAGNIERLANNLAKAAQDAALRKKFGRAARQQVEANFSLNKMVNELEALYTKFYPEPIS